MKVFISLLNDLLLDPTKIEIFRSYWEPEEQIYLETEKNIQSGDITFKSFPEIELTIVYARTLLPPSIISVHNHSTTLNNEIIFHLPQEEHPSCAILLQRYESIAHYKSVKVFLKLEIDHY